MRLIIISFLIFLNSLFPESDSYDPLRTENCIDLVGLLQCIYHYLVFLQTGKWYFAGALVVFFLTNSWTHMDSMLQARGYGLVVLCSVVLVYSTYLYIIEKKHIWFFLMFSASAIGIWTIPTFGFFALPLNALVVLSIREKTIMWGMLACYSAVALVYIPLLPEMLKINSEYTEKWGTEFGSLNAVSITLKNYLLPDSGRLSISLLCISLILTPIIPWKKLNYGNNLSPFKLISAAICLFFTVCLLLKTPAIRSVAFVVVPISIVLSSVCYVIIDRFKAGKYFKIILSSLITVFVYLDIGEKNKVLDLFYVPHENWLEAAAVVRQIFPSDQVSVFNNHRTVYLLKYLPRQLYDQ